MAYLIDGNNLLGFLDAGSLTNPKAREDLLRILLIFKRIKKTRIILVFDGPPDYSLMEQVQRVNKFTLVYPEPEKNADYVIKQIISKRWDKRKFFVVSSDREIRQYAESKGIKNLTCHQFEKELRAILKTHQKFLEYQKDTSPPTPLETKYWIEIFKKK